MKRARFLHSAALAALAGAGLAPGARAQSRDRTITLRVAGLERSYELHVPPGTAAAPRPLVVLLHGRFGTGRGMARLTRFDATADRAGVLVAYPNGWRRSWDDGRPGTPAERRGIDDVAFLEAVLHDVGRHAPVDTTRIYVAGMSNGGFMTERLACAVGARLAAIGIVAATLSDSLAATCHPAVPIAVMDIHGTADPIVPYAGGTLGDRGHVLSVDESVARWAAWDGCRGAPADTALPDTAHDGTMVTMRTYGGCDGGAEVVAVRVADGGHAWPGGSQYLPVGMVGRASRNLDASAALWAFFARHRR